MSRRSPGETEFKHQHPVASEGRSIRGSGCYSGVHTTVTPAKKNCLNQWQVVSCSYIVDGVTGVLAKSQAAKKGALVRFEKKSEGEVATQSQS